MGLFDFLFGTKKEDKKTARTELSQYFNTLSGYTPTYTSKDGGIYELGLCRACIHRIATECSKATPVIVNENPNYEFIVAKRPNQFMTASQFYYRLATIYEIENNAFIVPIEDNRGKVIGLYPVVPSTVEMKEFDGTVYVVYTFGNGEKKAVEYDRCGHVRKMQYKDDFYGDSNGAFKNTADLLRAEEEGTKSAIENGSKLRFMGKLNQQLVDEEDFKEQQQTLSKWNLKANDTGLFLYDSRWEEMTPISQEAKLLDSDQKKAIENSVFTYWNISEEILQNTYKEDTWNAFYESHIEPFFIQVGEVLTNMLYTEQEQRNGDEVLLTSDRLQYASNQTKIQVAKDYFDRGLITTNQALKILNMSPVEDGDKRWIRAEYVSLDTYPNGKPDSPTLGANETGDSEDDGSDSSDDTDSSDDKE